MATDEESLGKVHRQYNNTLKEAIADNLQSLDFDFKPSNDNTENFMKIDVANHKRNVDYILSVLKCEDSVYVSRALKRCAWLVTEPQYAHIVNPQHLHDHLFPHMTTKNYIKLIKHIKLTLKDETRAEEFYLSSKDPKEAVTWLPLCSVSFIENNIVRHIDHGFSRGKLGDLKVRSFKMLCEKSNTIFAIVMNKTSAYGIKPYLEAVTFLLHTNVDLYLDVLERVYESECVGLNENATEIIMTKSPNRVMDKFEKYIACIHVPTFARHLKRDYVKTFLFDQAKKKLNYTDSRKMRDLYNVYLKHFIKRLPKVEQFKFVKDVFIDKVYSKVPAEEFLPHTEAYGMMKLCDAVTSCSSAFDWYKYATFEIANDAYTKEITEKPDIYDKYSMLSVLITCADHNLQHIRTVLQHFLEDHKKHTTDSNLMFIKLNFINNLLSVTHINDYDEITWNLLNQIFIAMNVYKEDNENHQQCVESIIMYNTLHDLTIPEKIQKKFTFNTLKSYKATMTEDQKAKMFRYLYEYLISILKEPIENEEQFAKCVKSLENILQMFLDWEKELVDYPFVLNTIYEIVKIKKEHSWKTNLSSLYNMNKKWRRLMFSASLSLCASEETCLNALKHEPRLLARHSAELHGLLTTSAPRHLLTKLRLYWPHTIAKEWTNEYTKILIDVPANKALIRGLCTLLPREPLMNTIKDNAPEKARIDWNETDERTIALRRFIASNMHVARPQLTPDAILLYAKGDYLKFALPSVLAILYNINPSVFRVHIPNILDAPVSLQKHGLRFVYRRCNSEEVRKLFLNSWRTSKNLSIRAVIFYLTHTLLCKEKDDTKVVELWELMETFIDNLSFDEDKKVYKLLFSIENVPHMVRGKYLMKSYYFLQTFLPNAKSDREEYEMRAVGLAEYSRNIMQLLTSEFVIGLITHFIEKKYFNEHLSASNGMIQVISAYVLCAKDETTQTQRYENVLVPIMQRSLQMFDANPEKNFGRINFQALIKCLSNDLKNYVVQNNMIVPKKMFVAIQTELNKSVSIQRNYVLVTEWKLLVALTILVEKYYSSDNNWSDICNKIAGEFGKKCLDYLREDIKLHFPCIYLLFSKAFNNILNSIIDEDAQIEIYKQLLSDVDFIEGYLVTIQLLADKINCDRNKYKNIGLLLSNHNSVEVRFHYRNRIRGDDCE